MMNTPIELLFPPMADECRLLVGCRRGAYCASAMARAVEDCDAQVLNLNVTGIEAGADNVVVELRISHRNIEAVSRSLSRYGYDVLDASSSGPADDERLRARANEVLRILDL